MSVDKPSDKFIISIEDVRIYAYHGVFDFEREKGNEFILNLKVELNSGSSWNDELENTVSYADIYEVAKLEMMKPRNLLETVVRDISHKIKENFPDISLVECRLTKLNPPIPDFNGQATVSYILSD